MVLRGRLRGRVGHCQGYFLAFFSIEKKANYFLCSYLKFVEYIDLIK